MTKFRSIIVTLFMIVSFVGLADAGYLTYEHYAEIPLPCSNFACETVTTSEYSVLFGVIPLALLGVFYYLGVLMTSVYVYLTEKTNVLKVLSLFTGLGLITSVYLVYLQVSVIHAICIYCMASAGTSTLLFVLGMVYLQVFKNKDISS